MNLLEMASDQADMPRLALVGAQASILFISVETRRFVAAYSALLGRLIEEGFEVHVAACDHTSLDALRLMGVHVCALMPIQVGKPWTAPGALLTLQAYLSQHRFLICHIMEDDYAWLMSWMIRRSGVWVTVISGDDPQGNMGQWDVYGILDKLGGKKASTWLLKQLQDQIDMWLCSSMQSYDQLSQKRVFEQSALKVLSGGAGLDLNTFDPALAPSSTQARALMGVSDWPLVVGGDCSIK